MSARTLVELEGRLFLALDDGVHGEELWVTDGTEAGTSLVKDIRPGGQGSGIEHPAASAGYLFFVADDGAHGSELWRSDGTAEGTNLVRDLFPGSISSAPEGLVGLETILIFTANDGIAGIEVWRSDGSEEGTLLVKDIAPSFASSFPDELTRLGAQVFFRAYDDVHGLELWRTDGTEAGTVVVRDIVPGSGGSGPSFLEPAGSTLFFAADDEQAGRELWKTDGTAAGTSRVKDIEAGGAASWPSHLTSVGGNLFFITPGFYGFELWTSDGSEAGTRLVRFFEGAYPADIVDVAATPGLFYILVTDYPDNYLWRSDGTFAGTFEIARLEGDPFSFPKPEFWLTPVGSDLYYSGDDGAVGQELWKTDGTSVGTQLIEDLAPGPLGSTPRELGPLGGEVVFVADDLFHGPELWRSDGTGAGTELIRDVVERSADSRPGFFSAFQEATFFGATDGHRGYELWRTDGTEAGTVLVAERVPGPEPLVVVFPPLLPLYPAWSFVETSDGTLLAAVETQLWKSNGVDTIEQVPLPMARPEIFELIAFGGAAYFVASGNELWRSDGTLPGTFKIGDSSCQIRDLISVGNYLFFAGCSPDFQSMLWRTDGTAAGIEVIFEGYSRTPSALNGELVFSTFEGGSLNRLWQTTGGGTGTAVIADLPKRVTAITTAGPNIYLALESTDLWRSDGTQAGTQLLRAALYPIQELTAVGTELFFTADDSIFGEELWRSDGSVAGTRMVDDLYPGPAGSDPNELVSFDGSLFFAADDGLAGRELYRSDGTTAGTSRVVDLWPGEAGSEPKNLATVPGVLYFSASDGFWGRELWRVTAPPIVKVGNLALLEGDAGATPASLPVTLSHVSNSETRFSFATLPVTATGGEDFVSEAGTFVIPSGTLVDSLDLTVRGDLEIEEDEEFLVTLSSPIEAHLEAAQSRVTILNDDFELGGCGHPDVMKLHSLQIAEWQAFIACTRFALADSQVLSGGVLELTAGIRVELAEGLSIDADGRLTVRIDPSLAD